MKSKQAQIGTLTMLIILLVSSFVIGALVYKISANGKCSTNVETCRFSILAAANAQILENPISRLNCPRGELCDVELKKKDVVENGLVNQDKVHKILADAMAECWYMVGEGKLDPFSIWQEKTPQDKTICLLCKFIKFDEPLEKFLEETDQKITHPGAYLNKPMPVKTKTYSEYIYGKNLNFPANQQIELDDNSKIMVQMFNGDLISFWWNPLFFTYYWRSCPECKTAFSINIYPSTQSLDDIFQIEKNTEEGTKKVETEICHLIIN